MDIRIFGNGRRLAATIAGLGLVAAALPLFASAAAAAPAGPSPARTQVGARSVASPVGAGSCIETGVRRSHGAGAVARLGSDLDRAASRVGRTGASLRHELLTDSTLWVDGCGQPFYIDPARPEGAPDGAGDLTGGPADPAVDQAVVPYADTFTLHSRPGSLRTIYLDFDGYALTGTSWAAAYNNGTAWTAPSYDSDGNAATFSNTEREVIQSIWQRMSEDYALFDVDVTTQDPGFDAIDRSSSSDQRFGTRAVFTTDSVLGATCSCGGIAYIGVFDSTAAANYQPAFIFTRGVGTGAKNLSEAATHEVGHNLGLSHDGKTTGCGTGGTSACGYYSGAGAWAPIMGVGYYEPVTQWSKGEYTGATNTEDDLTVITTNGVSVVADDHGDTTATATDLGAALPAGATGEISAATDADLFRFTSPGGVATITVTPTGVTPNLDASLTLYDGAGVAIGTADPASAYVSTDVASGLSATYTSGALAAGTYYVGIDGVGQGAASGPGYSDYASLGRYAVAISDVAGPAVATSALPASTTGQTYRANLAASGGTGAYTWSLSSGSLPAGLVLGTDGSITGVPTGSADATFTVLVTDGAAHTATRTFTISAAVAITSLNLPEATQSAAYSTTLAAAGGTGSYTWSLFSGSLPAGLTISGGGTISGTPSAAGTTSFTIKALDGASRSTTKVLTITVAGALTVPANTSASSLPIGSALNLSMNSVASGGRPSYIWSLDSGTMPPGTRLNDNGAISGTPTTKGTYTSVARVTDRSGRTATTNLSLGITGFTFSPSSLPGGTRNAAYSQTLSVTFATLTNPVAWTISAGTLPTGITLSSGGVLSGTPTATGSFPITVKATDGAGVADTQAYTLVITGSPDAPTIGTASAGNAQATVTWTAPASNGGSAITGYVVTPYVGAVAQPASTFASTATSQTVSSLVNGTSYTFKVAATNVLGTGAQSAASNAVTPSTVPGTPTSVTASAGDAQATVSWSAPASDGGSAITGYVVTPYIGAVAQTASTFSSAATTQTISGLANGTSYTFKVAATNTKGTGAQSSASSAVTPATLPGAPTSVAATRGDGQATVSWTGPASSGGSAVTGYVVTPFIGIVEQTSVTFSSTATTQTVTGLSNGTSYTFQVAATNAVGTGSRSGASLAVTPAALPGKPTGVSGTRGSTSVNLTWSAPASDGGSAITGYVVTPSIGATAQSPLLFDATTSHLITGLVNGTTYTFTVAAVNDVGPGSASDPSTAVTPATVPAVPTSVTAVGGDTSATVSWTAPSSDGGSAVTGYVVTPYIGAVAQAPTTYTSTATSQSVTGLTNGTAYTFTVAAVNDVGTGSESGPSSPVTPSVAPTAPGAPSGVTAAGGDAQATVSWTAPASDGGSPLTGYVITPYAGATAGTPLLFDASATTRTVAIANGTPYTFTVKAVNAVGPGPESSSSNAVTGVASVHPPGAPTIANALPGDGRATVSWTAPASNGGAAVTGYVVTPYIGAVAQAPVTYNSTNTSQNVVGLVNGTTYTFKVAAKNSAGTGTASAESIAVTVGAPGVPGFQAAAPGNGNAKVSWTAANGNGSAVTGYVITPYIGAVAQPSQTFNSTATTQTAIGLANGTSYTFKVAATNARGTGAQATTAAIIVGTPTSPAFPRAAVGTTTTRVAWNASVANGAPISGYTVTPYVGSTPGTTSTFNSTATTQTISGLTSGVTYTFKVAAFNSLGTGPASQSGTYIQGAPGSPGYLSAVPANGGGVARYFVPAANSAPITSYTVWPVQGSTVLAPQVFNTPSATQLTVTGLTNGVTYSFRVAATNSVGTGAYASTNAVIAASPATPGFPSAQPGNGTAKLGWSPSADNGAPVTAYTVTPYLGAAAQPAQSFSGSLSQVTVTGLTNGATYTFKVTASNLYGTGLAATTALTTTVGAPTTPVFPGAAPLGGSAKVSWAAPTANASPITGYVITPVAGTTVLASQTFASPATSQVVTGLVDGTTYTFRVAAINAQGTGPYATTGSVKVGLPGAPTAVTAAAGAGQCTASWTAPASIGGSAITGYLVTPYIGGVAQPVRTFASPATSQVISGLTAGTAHTFKVQAVNSFGTGAASSASAACTPT